MAGQIIIISGTSGSGKSTTCELFAKRSDDFWLLYGIDHFLSGTFPAKFGHHGPRSREGIYAHPVDERNPTGALRWSFGENGTRAFHALHEWIAATSRAGCNIVLDHLMMTEPAVLQDCVWRLKGLPVLFVSLQPPFEVLEQRVASRKMDKKLPTDVLGPDDAVRKVLDRLSRLRPWFYQAVYANDCCDLRIDTSEHSPDAVCELIEQRLKEGPGTAFETLRSRYSPPPEYPQK
jgi:chloramphenicol 3-O-phosphotransferase